MSITLFKILKSSNLNLVQSLNQNGPTRQSGLHLVVVLDVVEDKEDDDDGHRQGAEGAADGQDDPVDPTPAGFRNFRFRRSMNLVRIRNKFVKKIAAVTGITRLDLATTCPRETCLPPSWHKLISALFVSENGIQTRANGK